MAKFVTAVRTMWRFSGFQNDGRPLSWIFKNRKFKYRYGSEEQCASMCSISWGSINPLLT